MGFLLVGREKCRWNILFFERQEMKMVRTTKCLRLKDGEHSHTRQATAKATGITGDFGRMSTVESNALFRAPALFTLVSTVAGITALLREARDMPALVSFRRT